MQKFFQDIIKKCTSEQFLGDVMQRYHYTPGDREMLLEVSLKMQACMERDAVWEHRMFRNGEKQPMTEVAMTLGQGIDELQENYCSRGLLGEDYMVEALGSELLLRGYTAYNQWIAGHTAYHVVRYHFLGSEENYPLPKLPGLLGRLGLPIRCNEAFCMLPKKSVAFYAALTEEGEVQCQGICVGCRSRSCPNRMEETALRQWSFADMTDRPLPYGYARIFGK